MDINIKYQTSQTNSTNLLIMIPQKIRNITLRAHMEDQDNIVIQEKFKINFDYRFTNYFYFKDNLHNDWQIKISDQQFVKDDGQVWIELSFNVKCLKNYYGNRCSTICVPFEDCNDCYDNGTLIELVDYCESDICIEHIRRYSKIKCPIKSTIKSTPKKLFSISSTSTMKNNFRNSPQPMKLKFQGHSYEKIVFEMKLFIGLLTFSIVFMLIFCIAMFCHFRQFSRRIHHDLNKIIEENKYLLSDSINQSFSNNSNEI